MEEATAINIFKACSINAGSGEKREHLNCENYTENESNIIPNYR